MRQLALHVCVGFLQKCVRLYIAYFPRRWPVCALGPAWAHYSDVIMGKMASQITSLAIVFRKHQSSASLAFERGVHGGGGGGVNSTHKWPVTRKMFPFDDVIMNIDTYIRIKQWNVIIEPRANFNGGSGKLMLKLWHEWVIISHIYLWM